MIWSGWRRGLVWGLPVGDYTSIGQEKLSIIKQEGSSDQINSFNDIYSSWLVEYKIWYQRHNKDNQDGDNHQEHDYNKNHYNNDHPFKDHRNKYHNNKERNEEKNKKKIGGWWRIICNFNIL